MRDGLTSEGISEEREWKEMTGVLMTAAKEVSGVTMREVDKSVQAWKGRRN